MDIQHFLGDKYSYKGRQFKNYQHYIDVPGEFIY